MSCHNPAKVTVGRGLPRISSVTPGFSTGSRSPAGRRVGWQPRTVRSWLSPHIRALSTRISITISDQAKVFIDREATRCDCSRLAYISSLIRDAEARAFSEELNVWPDSLSAKALALEIEGVEATSLASFSDIVESEARWTL